MPIQDDVARIALTLPDAKADDGEFSFRVNGRQFVHAWRERFDPTKITDSYDIAVGKETPKPPR